MGHLALQHGIASRNTAYAFFDEALKYDVIRPVGPSGDNGAGHAVPAAATLAVLIHWYSMHFQALDLIDGGDRAARFIAGPERIIALAQPSVADALLSSPDVRNPGPLYTIFTWADAGGLLMDRLIAGIDGEAPAEHDRFLTDISAIAHLAQSFGLSRAHTSRKFSAAESIGGVGWSGRRGNSRVWISRGFREEYARAQAHKLLILDDAFAEASALLARTGDEAASVDKG